MSGEESPAFDPAVLPEDGPGVNLIYRLTLAGIPSLLVATLVTIYLLPEDVLFSTRGIVNWFAPYWVRIRVDVIYIGSFS